MIAISGTKNLECSEVLHTLGDIVKYFSFVVRPKMSNSQIEEIIRTLRYEEHKQFKSRYWPGTELFDEEAEVYIFKISKKTKKSLIKICPNVFDWITPKFPEDICFYNDNLRAVFFSISHEKYFQYSLSENEFERYRIVGQSHKMEDNEVSDIDRFSKFIF